MEERDLKSAVEKIKKKKKRETLERLIIFLTGLLITLLFITIGLNFYSKSNQTVSEPDVKIATNIESTSKPPQLNQTQNQQKSIEEKKDENIQLSQQQQETVKPQNVENRQEETVKPQNIENNKPQKEVKQSKQVNQQQETVKPKQKEVVKQQTLEENKKQKEPTKPHTNKREETVVAKKEIPAKNNIEESKDILSLISKSVFAIQVGAFSTKEKAQEEKSKYEDAYIVEENGLYKVLIGKFKTEKEAREYQKSKDIKGFVKRVTI